MLQGLSHQAREAKSWPFEQARILLDRVLRLRLTDGERDMAAELMAQGKFAEAAGQLKFLGQTASGSAGRLIEYK